MKIKKGPITVITESAINRVPLMKLARLTEKEAKNYKRFTSDYWKNLEFTTNQMK